MKVTKFEHVCLDITHSNSRLIIDPSVYCKSFTNFDKIDAVVITHIHPDHFDIDKVKAIIAANPEVKIFTTAEVAAEISSPNVQVAKPGQAQKVGDFTLEFFGEKHAQISPEYPAAQNVGVLVNDQLYYPGDSLTECPKPYTVLAVPTMAPWLKFSESNEFLKKSPAKQVFPTHNGFINEDGQGLYDRLFGGACQNSGKEYKFVAPGESIEI